MKSRVLFLLVLVAWSLSAMPERKQRNCFDTTWWNPYVENIADEDTYIRRKFRQDVTDKTTGISQEAIGKRLEKCANLQVRVCGWNVRWNDLSRIEQDAYIRRAENVMKGW